MYLSNLANGLSDRHENFYPVLRNHSLISKPIAQGDPSMTFTDSRNETVPVQLPNGALVKVEVTQTGREDVGFDVKSFQGVTDAIEGVAEAITASLQKVSPSKALLNLGWRFKLSRAVWSLPLSKAQAKRI
jgi:hypothetical protein